MLFWKPEYLELVQSFERFKWILQTKICTGSCIMDKLHRLFWQRFTLIIAWKHKVFGCRRREARGGVVIWWKIILHNFLRGELWGKLLGKLASFDKFWSSGKGQAGFFLFLLVVNPYSYHANYSRNAHRWRCDVIALPRRWSPPSTWTCVALFYWPEDEED